MTDARHYSFSAGFFGLLLASLLVWSPAISAQPAPPAPADDAAPQVGQVEPSPLLIEPKTPEEQFRAALLLIDLGRFDLAPIYLKAFVDSSPDDVLLQQLRDRYGTGEFVRLTKIPEVRALALPLLDRLNEASRKQVEDPGYIDALIAKLSGTATERELATLELRNAGVRAVPRLLEVLASAQAGPQHDALVIALSRMGQPVVAPLIAALDANNEGVQRASIEVLANLKAEAAVPRLWPLVFGANVEKGIRDAARQAVAKIRFGDARRQDALSDVLATQELRDRAEQLLRRRVKILPEEAGQPVVIWSWDVDQKKLVFAELPIEVATLREARRAAEAAYALNPQQQDIQTLYLSALLASEVDRVGWETVLTAETSPALQAAISAGSGPLLNVLKKALEWGRVDAAWVALQGLSQLAGPEIVRSTAAGPSPIVRALNYPDPRLQFAAAIVILRSDIPLQFSGASRVGEILSRTLTDPGQARAIVIDPDKEEASLLGSYLSQEGYDIVLARTGKEGFTKAVELTGINLIVVHANVANWALTQTLSNLRADARSAYIPIVVYGPESVRPETARLINRTGNAVFAGESPAAESFWEQVHPLLQQRQTVPLSANQRNDFKSLAIYWLATLGTSPSGKGFPLATVEANLLPLYNNEAVAGNAVLTLSRIPTTSAQKQLSQLAINQRYSLPVRRSAAQFLVGHIQRYGLQLSELEVKELTLAWQQETDAELKSNLSAVMGTLKPNAGLIEQRLKPATPLSAPAQP